MIPVFLILAAILMFAFQSTALKKVEVSSLGQNLLVTGVSSGLIAVCLGGWALAAGQSFSVYTLGYGVLFGLMFIVTLAVYHFAMQSGPLSYTAFFFSASMLIPSAAGLIFWQEPFTWNIGAGILLFLAAFYFISVFGGERGRKGSLRWLLLCALTWLFNGGLSVVMNLQQKSLKAAGMPAEPGQMMLVSFAAASAAALIAWAVTAKGKFAASGELLKNFWLPILLVGVGTGLGNVLVAYLTGVVPSSYLFPFVQGGTMVAVTLYSSLALKEKINRFGQLGILLGVLAIVIINL